MKPSFLHASRPLLTAMIQCRTPEECIAKIRASLEEGADALGIHLCRLSEEYRTREDFHRIFLACQGKPIYVTSYRESANRGLSDEACVQPLLLALDCGATLVDLMGDLFDPGAPDQLTRDPEAIERQCRLIRRIHRAGGEVLISCHTHRSTAPAENLEIAARQVQRGADIIKIVSQAESPAEIPGYLESILKIQEMTDKKLLFLVSGRGRGIRCIGPSMGVCMYLCVQSRGPLDTPEQPLLKTAKQLQEYLL